jgi:amidase
MSITRRELLECAAGAGLAATFGCAAAPEQAPPTPAPAPAREPVDLARLDATAQARLVASGALTPRELVEAAIRRVEALDPRLNAVIARDFERALARADAAPAGPFRGVPYLVKDLTDYAGLPTRLGSRLFRDTPPASETHEVIRRAEAAGLVVIGKTNTSELGLLPTTQPLLFGPTRNPWDASRDPGGSSGGAASAVASGMTPIAQASDGGGSIRIPACNCGLFGLKPSRGRNPGAGETAGGLAVRHCVSRSVRDSATLLAHTSLRADEGSALPPPVAPAGAPLRRLRIATSTIDLFGRAAHPECAEAADAAARLCGELGHQVEEAAPAIDGGVFVFHFMALWASIPAALVAQVRGATGAPPPPDALEAWSWGCVEHFASLGRDAVPEALAYFEEVTLELARFHERYDVWLTPVLSRPAVAIGELAPDLPFDANLEAATRYASFTPLANVTGAPAMSVPLHWSAAGLPIGTHFQAPPGDEATLLQLAAQLEQARPWADRRPPITA